MFLLSLFIKLTSLKVIFILPFLKDQQQTTMSQSKRRQRIESTDSADHVKKPEGSHLGGSHNINNNNNNPTSKASIPNVDDDDFPEQSQEMEVYFSVSRG